MTNNEDQTRRQIPHSECIQGRCGSLPTGCRGECDLKRLALNNTACGDPVESGQVHPESAWPSVPVKGANSETKRAALANALRHAALDLLDHTRAAGACIEIEGAPPLYVVVGHAAAMGKLLPEATTASASGQCNKCVLRGSEGMPLCVGSCAKQGYCNERAPAPSRDAAPQAERAAVPECDDAAEGLEILDSLIENIEQQGNYSKEATLTFLGQIKQCFATPAAQEGEQGGVRAVPGLPFADLASAVKRFEARRATSTAADDSQKGGAA